MSAVAFLIANIFTSTSFCSLVRSVNLFWSFVLLPCNYIIMTTIITVIRLVFWGPVQRTNRFSELVLTMSVHVEHLLLPTFQQVCVYLYSPISLRRNIIFYPSSIQTVLRCKILKYRSSTLCGVNSNYNKLVFLNHGHHFWLLLHNQGDFPHHKSQLVMLGIIICMSKEKTCLLLISHHIWPLPTGGGLTWRWHPVVYLGWAALQMAKPQKLILFEVTVFYSVSKLWLNRVEVLFILALHTWSCSHIENTAVLLLNSRWCYRKNTNIKQECSKKECYFYKK